MNPKYDEPAFAELLREVRRNRGISRAGVAKLLCAVAGLSTVDRREIWRWETNQRVPSRYWCGYLAVVLRTPLGELLMARRASTSTRMWDWEDKLSPRKLEVLTEVANSWRAERGMRPAQVLGEADVNDLRAVCAEALLSEQD
jgi:transcriptional regulator with XRE-family HTH domain